MEATHTEASTQHPDCVIVRLTYPHHRWLDLAGGVDSSYKFSTHDRVRKDMAENLVRAFADKRIDQRASLEWGHLLEDRNIPSRPHS